MRKAWVLAIGAALAGFLVRGPAQAQAQSLGPSADSASASSWTADSFLPGPAASGASSWRGLIWPPMSGGVIDHFGLAAAERLRGPDGQPFLPARFEDDGPLARLSGARLRRDWPSAVRLKTGAFGFDVSPHAGLDHSSAGDSRNAGALVRFGRGLGLDDAEPGRRSKWFLFASADQETLGMNFMRNEDAWKRAGLGPDPGAVIADTRAGLAWRDGPFQASVGYLYREIKPRDWDMLGAQTNQEHLVAFRLSLHPGER